MTSQDLTVVFEGEAAEKLHALAQASGRSAEWFADFIIREYAAREMRLVEDLQAGLRSVREGSTMPHAEAMQEVDDLLTDAETRTTRRAGSSTAR